MGRRHAQLFLSLLHSGDSGSMRGTELNNAKRMRTTSRFWNENKGIFYRRHFRFCLNGGGSIASEIHLLDCLARKEQDEITVADLKQYSVVKITLMTRYLDD